MTGVRHSFNNRFGPDPTKKIFIIIYWGEWERMLECANLDDTLSLSVLSLFSLFWCYTVYCAIISQQHGPFSEETQEEDRKCDSG
jgi:hypothetical protein